MYLISLIEEIGTFNFIAGVCSIAGFGIAIIGIIPMINNIRISFQENNLRNLGQNGLYKICDKRVCNKTIEKIIMKAFGKDPELYYDKGIFCIGWNWYINNFYIMKIEKHIFGYKYAILNITKHGENQITHSFSVLKKLNVGNLRNDKALKEVIELAEEYSINNNSSEK